jgi:hypothetical protein
MVRYCPILRHSNSEMNAFKNLKTSSKAQLLPIIEGKRIPKANKLKWDGTLNSSGKYLLERVGSSEFIYDFKNMFDNLQDHNSEIQINSKNPVQYIMEKFAEANLNYIPCFNHDSPEWLIKDILRNNSSKIAIRIRYHEISAPLNDIINNHVLKIAEQFQNKHIYFIHDYKDSFNLDTIKKNLRSFTGKFDSSVILSISTLDTKKDVAVMTFKKICDQSEILIFNEISKIFPKVLFSDYTTRLTPEPDTKTGFNINKSYLKIIYTTPKGYYLGKSEMYENGEPENFQEVCKIIVDSGLFSGENFSLADNLIKRCSLKKIDILTHQQTIELSINHHIEFIVTQL